VIRYGSPANAEILAKRPDHCELLFSHVMRN
jgi:hypothetical protein